MSDEGILLLRVNSINCRPYGRRSLTAAARHNKRTLMHSDDDPIDQTRSHLNQSLLDSPGTPEGVVERANTLMAERGFEPRRADTCIAAEGMFSLREVPRAFDMLAYFSESALWFEERLGGRLLSADVHLDQSHPHCHVLVLLPLVNGGPSGSSLIEFKHESSRRVQAFFEEVASKYGLRMPPPGLSAADKKRAARDVHQRLYANCDPVTGSELWPRFSNCINRDPRGFAADLGITTQGMTRAALSALACSPGKGPRTAAAESASDNRLKAAWQGSEGVTTPKGVAPTSGSPSDGPDATVCEPSPDQHPSRVSVAAFLSTGVAAHQSSGPVKPAPQASSQPPEAPTGLQETTPASPEPRWALPAQKPMVERTVERDDLSVEQWDGIKGQPRALLAPQPRGPKAAEVQLAALLQRMKQPAPAEVE